MSRWMDRAVEVARTSTGTKKVGAVLTKNGKFVSESPNFATKSHPQQSYYAKKVGQPRRIYLHAEQSALIRARSDADTIYVARLGAKGDLRLSKPCSVCMAAIKELTNIKTIWYTDKGNWVKVEV